MTHDDDLDEIMVAVYREMRKRRQWIWQAAHDIGISRAALDNLLVGVTMNPRPATIQKLITYANGTSGQKSEASDQGS